MLWLDLAASCMTILFKHCSCARVELSLRLTAGINMQLPGYFDVGNDCLAC
jgi:hypothetical protein